MNILNIPSNHYKPGFKRDIDLIVVHSIGQYIDTENEDYHAIEWLKKLGLSTHYFVDFTGPVIRCVNENDIAWHAKGFNTNSIGIELMVPGIFNYGSFLEKIKKPWIGGDQYDSLVKLVKDLKSRYDAKVVRHSDIDPSRKVDPGAGFPWEVFLKDIS